ncbi:unannotated protein [freshwater metagenome]|uniref:Unannotated protein n=1 Tax=freshwater metagenome TaxID=449393 RepID=A0A6J6HZX6_9ZZZZ
MCACAVPVALHWLCIERDNHVVIFCDAVEQPTCNVHVVGHCKCIARSDLEFPLTRHYFGICARNKKACIHASLCVLFDDLTTDNATCADATVVRTLWLRESAYGETVWSSVETKHGVFLLDAVPHFLVGILCLHCCKWCTSVGGVRRRIFCKKHVTHDKNVLATTDWIWALEHRAQDAVG